MSEKAGIMFDVSMNRKYMVMVLCLTYNHELYLEDALKGFVMQKTNFPFIAVVIDDCSTDGTANILHRYEGMYPDIIKAFYLPENYYSQGKSKYPFYKEYQDNSKYIALCEGDDYWTDPLKLQKQVDILEKDETLMACVTNCSMINDKGKTIKEIRGGVVKGDVEGRYNLRQFFNNSHQYPTLSVVYRNSYCEEVREKTKIMSNPYLGDWTLWIALHCFGDFYFLNEVTCAYRINPTSLTHSNTIKRRIGLTKENFRLLPAVASVLPAGFEDIQKDLRENTAWIWWDLSHAYFKAHKYLKALWFLFRCGLKSPTFLFKEIKKVVSISKKY